MHAVTNAKIANIMVTLDPTNKRLRHSLDGKSETYSRNSECNRPRIDEPVMRKKESTRKDPAATMVSKIPVSKGRSGEMLNSRLESVRTSCRARNEGCDRRSPCGRPQIQVR